MEGVRAGEHLFVPAFFQERIDRCGHRPLRSVYSHTLRARVPPPHLLTHVTGGALFLVWIRGVEHSGRAAPWKRHASQCEVALPGSINGTYQPEELLTLNACTCSATVCRA